MSNRLENALWILVVTVFIGLIAYIGLCAPGREFWESTASGLLSTAVALIAGIPIALSIDRAIKKKDSEREAEETRNKEIALLNLLKDELESCKAALEMRKEKPDNLYIQPFKSDLWHAISAAGQLNLISSPTVLNELSDAYYIIDTVRRIEEQGYKASRSATVSFGSGGTATEILFKDARRFNDAMSQTIESALSKINGDIGASRA
ncbi:MAG: hypothetical protein HY081_00555 [Gammaproteobacteria bacterium]|nr:hypothetical protein [Gammaproteobacteria bacterium]